MSSHRQSKRRRHITWAVAGAAVVAGAARLVGGDTGRARLTGLVLLVLGPVFARVYAELVIVLFRIHDLLRELRDLRAGA